MRNAIILLLLIIPPAISVNAFALSLNMDMKEQFKADYSDVLMALEQEKTANPKNYRTRLALGILYLDHATSDWATEVNKDSIELLGKAEVEFQETLKFNKENATAYYYLGHVAVLKQQNNAQAIGYYLKSIKSDPMQRKAYFKLNTLYIVEKNYESAANSLENAEKIIKDDANLYHRLSITYLFLKKYNLVIENANKALSINKNTESQLVLSSGYSLSGKYEEAKKELEDVLSREPKDRNALLGLSTVFQRMGKKENAIEVLNRALEHYPSDAEILNIVREIKVGKEYK